MQTLDGQTVYAATDLVGYLECEHLTELERAALAGLVERPVRDDPELAILRERGIEHETRFLAWLEDEGHTVVDGRIGGAQDRHRTLAEIRADAERTRQLMHDAADVIYQATLFDGTWLGYVDFLMRVEVPSDLGAHSYEVLDTKLARRTKGGALLQMCVYSDLVAGVQGRMPEWMHVALGGSGHRVDRHRLDDYLAYYRSVKSRFADAVAAGPPGYPLAVVPNPVTHCGVCRWDVECSALRARADHLTGVASLRVDQAKRLAAAGIGTMTRLAELQPPLPAVDGISEPALEHLRAQAALQVRSRGRSVPEVELLPLQPNLGLAALPAPARGDIYFDIEGDPYAEEDGLEYLFGAWDPDVADGEDPFLAWWAHSRDEEKVAFEQLVDFLMDRWRRFPDMHVFHYAAYERGHLGMLSTRHATREAEVDAMLRGGLFVDLYRVVRQAMRVGTASYSIKKLEPLYALEREIALKDAGSSIVRYEEYIRSVVSGSPNAGILAEIAEYNRDDCRSTWELRRWLEQRRDEVTARDGVAPPRPGPVDEREKAPTPRDLRLGDLVERLLANVPVLAEQRAADPGGRLQATWLLANLLEWHRREEKVEWWAFFDRCTRSDAELVEDEESIGQLTWVGEVDRPKRSVRHRYRFDPEQPYRLKAGDDPVNPATGQSTGTIVDLDPLKGTLDLQWGLKVERPHPTSLIPHAPITADAQKAALERIGEWVAANGIEAPGMYRAAREFLLRRVPRAGQSAGASLAPTDEPIDAVARRLVARLDQTILPVQGPPGAGKTYVGAEMILELVRAGRRIGITGFTHRALTNLLDEVLDHADRAGVRIRAIRKVENGEAEEDTWRYTATRSNDEIARALAADLVQVAAGTSYLWARPELEGLVDTLFVDEAGQLSLANVVAISGAARNLVLLGDPQQLSQVKKGAHPDGVDLSSLEFALDGAAVIPAERGLFLPETHRLHPDVNAFTSEIFYESRLHSAPETRQLHLEAPGALTGTGVRWLPVAHTGNRNASPEEAGAVAELYRLLLTGTWIDVHGAGRTIAPDAVLVVTPYNAQAELLAETLAPIAEGRGGTPRVGTVDKIQGQQAAVVIYSMASSSQDELPRSMEFLYSLNRLNVATSRGRCLAAIVCSPDLLRVSAHTPYQMRLANALCRFVELSPTAAASAEVGKAAPAIPRPSEHPPVSAPQPLTFPWGRDAGRPS